MLLDWREPSDAALRAIEAEQAADNDDAMSGIIPISERCGCCNRIREVVDGICGECDTYDEAEAA